MAEYDGTFTKQPTEKLKIRHNFSSNMEAGEAIVAGTLTATKLSDLSDATNDIIVSGSLSWTQVSLVYGVQAGTDGEMYKIALAVTTTKLLGTQTNVRLEAEHLMTVEER